MTNEEKQLIRSYIEEEGFGNTFLHYSDFEEIQDEKFHELREKFINATIELADYCNVEFIF